MGWVAGGNRSVEALKGLLVLYAADGMVAYLVGTAVNRSWVEGEGLIVPA
jgi:hypothetical protein